MSGIYLLLLLSYFSSISYFSVGNGAPYLLHTYNAFNENVLFPKQSFKTLQTYSVTEFSTLSIKKKQIFKLAVSKLFRCLMKLNLNLNKINIVAVVARILIIVYTDIFGITVRRNRPSMHKTYWNWRWNWWRTLNYGGSWTILQFGAFCTHERNHRSKKRF